MTNQSHSILCTAPATIVYDLISHTADWPRLLEPCRSVKRLSSGPGYEVVEISATLNGTVASWQSRRRLLPEVFGVEAEIVVPMPLVESMRTSWRVIDLNDAQSLLLLEHEYAMADDVNGQVDGVESRAEAERLIDAAVDRNSLRELRDFKRAAEFRAVEADHREFRARHSVVCAGPATLVYGIIRDVSVWPDLFEPCVATAVIEESGPTQVVRVQALQEGRRVSWDSRRRYRDEMRRVDYELIVPMPFVEAMSGEWRVVPLAADRCLLTVDRWWRIMSHVSGVHERVGTVPQAAAFVSEYVNRNAVAEMESIRAFVAGNADLGAGRLSGSTLLDGVAGGVR